GLIRDPYVAQYDDPAFAAAATEAILNWRYRPAESDGHPVDSQLKVRILFRADPWPASMPADDRPVHVFVQPE
ncbi:MAG TPA: energy transducer TonB, partial [Opitutaceae bacterium]|nr:energy transducer TonB [Opitutaceae bacterium]